MGVLALSAQSVVEALTGAALQPRLRRLLVSMETTQPGLEPWQTQRRIISNQTQDVIVDRIWLIWSFSHLLQWGPEQPFSLDGRHDSEGPLRYH